MSLIEALTGMCTCTEFSRRKGTCITLALYKLNKDCKKEVSQFLIA
jgi:excinuclease UvrABC nuclease subunit